MSFILLSSPSKSNPSPYSNFETARSSARANMFEAIDSGRIPKIYLRQKSVENRLVPLQSVK